MILNSGMWPCGVCGKGVQPNSVQCRECIKWIYKRGSGVHGELSLVADGFRCKLCDGTIQEADLAWGPTGVWRVIWMCKVFCYLGDNLDGDGRAELVGTARIING